MRAQQDWFRPPGMTQGGPEPCAGVEPQRGPVRGPRGGERRRRGGRRQKEHQGHKEKKTIEREED
eukprot:7542921-Pyramimonas_sp.AAC.1